MQDPILTPLFVVGVEALVGVPVGLTGGGFAVATVGGVAITTGQIAAVLSAATVIGASVAVNYAMQPDVPRPEQGTIPLRQTVPPRIRAFGEVRLAGNYMFYEMGSFGTSVDILALCQGPIGGFKKFFMDDKPVNVDPATGRPNLGIFGNFAYTSTLIWANKGAKLNTAWDLSSLGLGGIWTPDHRGDAVVSLRLMCQNQPQNVFLKFFPHGLPRPSAALFAPCWDFRDPAQSPDDQATWLAYPEWDAGTAYTAGARVLYGGIMFPFMGTAGGMLYVCRFDGAPVGVPPDQHPGYWAPVWKNPVLQVVTFLTNRDFGMGLPRDRLITPALASLTAQAALCDEVVELAGIGLETRYTSNPWWKLETEPSEVLGQMLASCDGWLSIDGDGALAMRVGVFEPPTVTLDESMILSVEVNYGAADEEKVDELTLTYTSPQMNYTTQAADSWRDEEAILTRGKVRTQAFGPSSVHSASQVRRLAKRIFLRNNAIRGALTTHLGGMIAAGQRYVLLDYPLIPELDRVPIELRRRTTDLAARQCHFEFVVVDPELLDGWVPADEEGAPPPTPIPPLPPEPLPVPQDVTATEETGPPYRIVVSWDDPVRPDLSYVVRYRISDIPGAWVEQEVTAPTKVGDQLVTSLQSVTEGTNYEIQVASKGAGGTISDWSASEFVGTPIFPKLDYSRPANSAKWLWLGGF